ncbi:hypothetical protein AB6A40_003716 [Gnathostoma spinigerum]|uniref:Uncharacterized protein n=1 Tax=Gnathostoma spinigerum TaxID=75299 RepID=A0ABD6ECL0_9BILA
MSPQDRCGPFIWMLAYALHCGTSSKICYDTKAKVIRPEKDKVIRLSADKALLKANLRQDRIKLKVSYRLEAFMGRRQMIIVLVHAKRSVEEDMHRIPNIGPSRSP